MNRVWCPRNASTQIVVWNDDRLLGGASQFQPPSSNCSWRSRSTSRSIARLAEAGTQGQDPPVYTGLDLALEEGRVVEFRPPGVIADEADRVPGSLARSVQTCLPSAPLRSGSSRCANGPRKETLSLALA
jgi:hypothetical protein